VVARQQSQTPGPVQVDAAVAGPQAGATTPGGEQRRDGGADERRFTPHRLGTQVAIGFLQPLPRSLDPLHEVLRDGQAHQSMHRQATGKLAQHMSAHAVGDGPKFVLGLVETGVLVDLADSAWVGARGRGPAE